MLSDIEIAQAATMEPIGDIAAKLGIPFKNIEPYGHFKAKVHLSYLAELPVKTTSHLILITAISPTPPGEGKTTTSVGLADGLSHIGKDAMVCLREPSLGPVFWDERWRRGRG